MRTAFTASFVILCSVGLAASPADPSDAPVVAAAQQLFDAMKSHDASAASALFLPGATLASVDAAGKPSVVPFEKFVEHIGASKSDWLERIWNAQVLQHGSIAVVWAPYDFHLDGKFSHCGVDSFSLVNTATGWKIAAISDTREKAGCAPSPLGPPKP